jgi:hypothetical protein
VFLAPFASEYADGLEWVGGRLGFLREGPPSLPVPIPDYRLTIPRVDSPRAATAVAGVVGTLAVFGVGLALARGLSRRVPERSDRLAGLGSPPVLGGTLHGPDAAVFGGVMPRAAVATVRVPRIISGRS